MLTLLASCSPARSFDPVEWQEANERTRDRAEMVDDLLAQHDLNGLSHSEVRALLGEPTRTNAWDWDMLYVLGPTEPMPIDHEWLAIRLRADGHVSDYRVIED